MTLTQFIKTNQGKKVDFDGKYGAQCVDLYRAYCRDVLDIQQTPAVAGAKDIITKPGVLEVTRDSALADYSRGDVLVWDATSSNKYGHVAILVAVYNTKYFIDIFCPGVLGKKITPCKTRSYRSGYRNSNPRPLAPQTYKAILTRVYTYY